MRGNWRAYRAWAPDGVTWAQWAKPVLFADMPMAGGVYMPGSVYMAGSEKIDIPELDWIDRADHSTAVIVDFPGAAGVLEGLALARIGYRPVPLYNGVMGPGDVSAAVPVYDIVNALCVGAAELSRMSIEAGAPPAFMLDMNRMTGSAKIPGTFDNRWCVFPQDMPSASHLLANGITSVVVRSHSLQRDLLHILCRYEDQGITAFLNNGRKQERIALYRPRHFMGVFYRFGVVLGLKRNSAGGFGGMVPDADSSGRRYYGLG